MDQTHPQKGTIFYVKEFTFTLNSRSTSQWKPQKKGYGKTIKLKIISERSFEFWVHARSSIT